MAGCKIYSTLLNNNTLLSYVRYINNNSSCKRRRSIDRSIDPRERAAPRPRGRPKTTVAAMIAGARRRIGARRRGRVGAGWRGGVRRAPPTGGTQRRAVVGRGQRRRRCRGRARDGRLSADDAWPGTIQVLDHTCELCGQNPFPHFLCNLSSREYARLWRQCLQRFC